eukprot:NODE_11268_length_1297_cov_7.275214.p1 GENE.NODE_11268_length_1297_cov_7.275214~~NODE_11268_length_1297_cov_7.275214.p1  ORF type:complete len:315 (-),score=92.35 NODE_11268_length_1297_cov_7.275214:268-1212(-)
MQSVLEAAKTLQERVEVELQQVADARREAEELRATVERERLELEAEKRAVQTFNKVPADLVAISAGGHAFKTRRSTLCQVEGSLLSAMFSGRWDDSLTYDDHGAVFLDASPQIFEVVLSYLRALAIDARAKMPEVDQNLKAELLAFRDFMMLDSAGRAAACEPLEYTVQSVAGLACEYGDNASPAEAQSVLRRAERIAAPNLGENLSLRFCFGTGTIVLRLPSSQRVSGVRLWCHCSGLGVSIDCSWAAHARLSGGGRVELGKGTVKVSTAVAGQYTEQALPFTPLQTLGETLLEIELQNNCVMFVLFRDLSLF